MTCRRRTAPSSADFATALAPTLRAALVAALVALLLAGCKPGAESSVKPGVESLGGRETFTWEDEPISFTPPPKPWAREKELSGGLMGIRFVKVGGGGEGITVAEYYPLGQRTNRAVLRELLERLELSNHFEVKRALDRARRSPEGSFTPADADVARRIDAALSKAQRAHDKRDFETARAQIETAQQAIEELEFTLDDVIDAVIFQPEKRNEPQMYKLLDRRDVKIAGEPAVTVDYTVHVRDRLGDRLYYGREAYVMHKNHLFVAQFIGWKETLPLFDSVVASISFPP